MSNCTSNNKPLTTEEFITRAILKHGELYDYSQVKYIKNSVKIDIICKTHGVFKQAPNNHIAGNGCPLCKRKNVDTKSFILSAIEMHGNRYDYSLVEYKGNSKKVKIICKIHGVFEQRASNHLYWNGCKDCISEDKSRSQIFTNNEILAQFKKSHGDTYDYSLVKYSGIDSPVQIICRVHGEFKQAPYQHRKTGSGCPICTKATPYSRTRYISACSKYGGKSSLYIVKMFNDKESFYKVGITVKSVNSRFKNNPYNISEIKLVTGDAGFIYDLETQLHRILSKYHYKPNQHFGGCRLECFSEMPKSVLNLVDRINKSKQLQLIA